MALEPGDRLGHYVIVSSLGRGGMGEVYRARDSKLGRDVALKILPDEVARDADRLSRFEREARALASLNHPNISIIHGIEGSAAGSGHEATRALVMELVEGETLADTLRRRGASLPLHEALAIARQIADGLDAAHEKGIVHRDLKPANVMITAGDRVKILDFGLAKIAQEQESEQESSRAPTIRVERTRDGMLLGTTAYMSPEQARGQAVDKRTDIWAFGCVLFEMLAGRPAFSGESTADTIAGILGREPDAVSLPADTPPHVRDLIAQCLQKDPRRRLRDIGDARTALERDAGQPASSPAVARPALGRVLPWAVASVAVALAAVIAMSSRPGSPVRAPIYRLPTDLTPGEPLSGYAMSPDGQYLAYASGQLHHVYLRDWSSGIANRVTDRADREAGQPFFSPDGRSLGFVSGGVMMKVPVSGGGVPVELAKVSTFRGAAWTEDNQIVFAPDSRKGLSIVSANGGTESSLTTPDAALGETSHRNPTALPGGRAVVFVSEDSRGTALVAFDMTTRTPRTLFRGGNLPVYSPTGHLLFVLDGSLVAARFDLETLTMEETPIKMIENVANYSLAATAGNLAYRNPSEAKSQLTWVNRAGDLTPLLLDPAPFSHPRISPDGQRIVVAIGGDGRIWMYDIAGDNFRPLTVDRPNLWPVWASDDRVAYASNRAPTAWDIFWRPADGSGMEEPLLPARTGSQIPRAVSPDGTLLAFTEDADVIHLLNLGTEPRQEQLFRADARQPAFSPDSKLLAYVSTETGNEEVHVRPVSGRGQWQVSNGGGTEPLWGRDKRELFYRHNDQVWAVDVSLTPTFSFSRRRPLFDERGRFAPWGTGGQNYDVAPDGRFLMMTQRDSDSRLNVVINWTAELTAREQ